MVRRVDYWQIVMRRFTRIQVNFQDRTQSGQASIEAAKQGQERLNAVGVATYGREMFAAAFLIFEEFQELGQCFKFRYVFHSGRRLPQPVRVFGWQIGFILICALGGFFLHGFQVFIPNSPRSGS